MANGPLGGNMGTPPVPPQPPQVSFETTAQSRGNFNNFLKSMPNTTSMTPIPPMGSSPMMPAPDPMASIDIFNQPVNMRIGGLAGNPLDSYGDYLSQQIDNTQVEPFIQEVQQMASQRFNLGSGDQSINASQPLMKIAEPLPQPSIFQRIPQQYPQDLSRPNMEGEPLLSIFNPEINSFQPFNPPQEQDMTQRPAAPFQMQGLGQPMRDKDGILREPMGLRGGSDMFTTLDQQIYDDGFMPGSQQLQGSLPRTFFNGGEVDDSDFGGFSDYGSVDATSDDGFSEDNDVSDYSTDDSGVYTGDDSNNQDVTLPTPRPEILKEAIGRAENQVFGDPEGDALGFFNKAGGLTDAGQKEYDSAIMANLDLLQDERPADTGTQLANVFDNQGILSASTKNVNPADIVQASFRPGSLNPTFSGNVLDGLDLNTAFGQNRNVEPEAFDMFGNPMSELTGQRGVSISNRAMQQIVDNDLAQSALDARGDLDSINYSALSPAPATTTSSVNPSDFTGLMSSRSLAPAPTTDSIVEAAIKDAVPSRSISDILSAMNQKTDLQSQVAQSLAKSGVISGGRTSFSPDVFDPTSLQISDMVQTIGPEVASGFSPVGSGISPSFTADQVAQSEVDQAPSSDALGFASNVDPNDRINFVPSTVGDDAFDDSTFITDPTTMVEAGVPSIEAPKEFRDPFKNAGIGAIPTLTSLANKFSAYSRGRVLDSIAQKGYTPVYDGDVIVGAKNKSGQLMEGMDPNAPMDTGDDNNENPFILKPKAEEEEKEEEDKPPNVIGGGVPTPVPEPVPTIVDSPFTSNVADFVPSTFNTGDINKLIEMLTGVAAPKSMKKGGVAGYAEGGRVMQALDNLLATA